MNNKVRGQSKKFYNHDDIDRLTSETTSQGTVSYTYDDAGRRSTMTASGQATVSYGYDDANQLRSITQGSNVVSFDYDAAGRRTQATLPNGIVVSYSYDDASQLTGMTYSHGTTVLGEITYAYNADGQRIQMGGSYARSNLPAPLTSATYNAANQLTSWEGTTLTYDANGNMLNDGIQDYTWDAQNRLLEISTGSKNKKVTIGAFNYDPLGRRQSKAVDSIATDFLYDGLNPIQEMSGQGTTNLLTGLGIDERYLLSDGANDHTFITDALGSTLALSDNTGAVETEYTYEPYGNTTASGSQVANAYQYTGRENDGTGLYYYRARYYHPVMQRFISEDPIGFGGGINSYTYVVNDPINFTDPVGLWAWGLNFGGSFTIPRTEFHIGVSVGFVADHNGTSGILLTTEYGAGTHGGGIFARGLLALGNDTTVDSLVGYGVSTTASWGKFSGSISTSFCSDDKGNLTGDVIPPVVELGVGKGATPEQFTITGTYSTLYGRNNVLGDTGRWWGSKFYEWLH